MKKINRIFNVISINILVLFLIGFFGTYFSDLLNEYGLFGDYCDDNRSAWDGQYCHWGARHYWYVWGVFFLFVANLVRSVFRVISVIKEEYPEIKI